MPADLLAPLAAPALFIAAGAGLQALAPRPLERSLTACAGLAFLLGAAWCATTVWAANLLFGVAVARPAFLAAGALAIAGGAAAIAARRRALGGWRRAPARPPWRGQWAGRLLAIGSAAIAATLLADALLHPVTDFDGRMTWGTLARYVQAERNVLPGALLDPQAHVIHPRYPLAMPLLQVAAAELAGAEIESRAIRPLYALFYPALLAVLWPFARRAGGRRAAALATAAVAWAPVLLWDQEVGPLGTYSDLALAAFLGGALAALLHPAARRQAWRGWGAGLLLAAAAATKNEGLLLAPAVLAAVALAGGRRPPAQALSRAALMLALGAALVLGWRDQIPNRNDEAYFEELSLSAIARGLPQRLPAIVDGVARRTFDLANWGAIWLLPAIWIVGRRGTRTRPARACQIVLTAQLGMVVAAYAVVPDLAVVAVTWDRFLVQALPALVGLTAATARGALGAARAGRAPAQKALESSPPQ